MGPLTQEQTQALIDQGYLTPQTGSRLGVDSFDQPLAPPAMPPVVPEPTAPLNQPMMTQTEQPPPPNPFFGEIKTPVPPPPAPAPMVQETAPAVPVTPGVSEADLALPGAPKQTAVPVTYGSDLTKGLDMQQKAIQDQADIGTAMGLEKAAQEKVLIEENEKMQKLNQAKQDERAKRVQEGFADLDDQLAKMQNIEIDTGRFWKNSSTASKVLAGIGLALGALGGDNRSSLQMIQSAINNDIDAQKADIQNKKSGVAAQRGILKDMQDHYGDMAKAEDATRLAYINNTQAKIENMMQKYKNQDMQAKAQGLIGELEQKKVEIKSQLANKFYNTAAIGPNLKPEELAMLPEKVQERYVDGFGVAKAGTQEEVKTFKTDLADAMEAKANISAILAIAEKPLKEFSPEMSAEVATRAQFLKGQLRSPLVGPGTVSATDQKLLDSIIADPTTIFSWDAKTKKRYETINKIIDTRIATRANLLGLQTPEQRMGLAEAVK